MKTILTTFSVKQGATTKNGKTNQTDNLQSESNGLSCLTFIQEKDRIMTNGPEN